MRKRRHHGVFGLYSTRWRVGAAVVAVFISALLLVSCVAGSNALWVRGILGLDIGAYAAEPVEQALPTDGDLAHLLCETVRVVLTDDIRLSEFRGASQAVKLYRDEILNSLLRSDYAAYTGKGEDLERVAASYPTLSVATLISAKSFEGVVSRHFGGSSVNHKDGETYQYLDKAAYYTTPLSPVECRVTIEVLLVEETANTYRMEFRLSDGEQLSSVYRAIFVKRDGASPYWKTLELL